MNICIEKIVQCGHTNSTLFQIIYYAEMIYLIDSITQKIIDEDII